MNALSQTGENTRTVYCGNQEMLIEGLSCCSLISVSGIFIFRSSLARQKSGKWEQCRCLSTGEWVICGMPMQ